MKLDTLLKKLYLPTEISHNQTVIDHISLNSTTIGQNGLFLAYKGYKQDGRKFIQQALDQGASAIFYDNHFEGCNFLPINTTVPLITIENIKHKLAIIAKAFYGPLDEQKKLFGIDKLNIKRSEIPAVTHVDYSARVQTVSKNTNNRYYDLISKFKEKTGCPVLVNTSFNVRGEPIVNTPTDAFNCFMGTELDFLIIGNCVLDKTKQNPKLKKDYTKKH